MSKQDNPVVIDLGSGQIKVGFGGDVEPTVFFPSVVSRPPHQSLLIGKGQRNVYVGNEAQTHRESYPVKWPINRGIISSIADTEELIRFIYKHELCISSKEHPVLLTETLNNPKLIREKMTEIMFETFEAPSLFMATQAVLSLYASSRTTGVIFDSGDDVTNVASIYEGLVLPKAIKRSEFAGRDLTKCLAEMTRDKIKVNLDVMQQIKERLCFVASDVENEKNKVRRHDQTMLLPDGKKVNLGNESFLCPEFLFDGSLVSRAQDLVYQSIHSCDEDIRSSFLTNIVLAGGTTMLPGFTCRLQKEVQALVPAATEVKIFAPTERKFSAWIGGSILTSLATFPQMSISKKEYEEFGSDIINQKCF